MSGNFVYSLHRILKGMLYVLLSANFDTVAYTRIARQRQLISGYKTVFGK
jgi:hypothetical protein